MRFQDIRVRRVTVHAPFRWLVNTLLSCGLSLLFAVAALAQAGQVEIAIKHSNKCLDVTGGSRADQAVIQQFGCHGGANQIWRLEPAANNYYRIVSQNSGKCLDVPGGSRQDGAVIQQFTCHGGPNQLWRLESAGNGYYKIISQNSGKCLDVSDGSLGDHAALQQFSCHGGANQLWRLNQAGKGVRQATVLLPFNHNYRVVTYELIGGRMIMEGDIEIRPEMIINVTEGGQVQGGVGTSRQPASVRDRARWPGGVILFEIAPGFNQSTLQDIQNAIAHINQRTNLRLIPREGHSDYVRFTPVASSANFCGASCVGRVGGSQDIQIAPGCGMGSAAHEIAHAAGLWHEQSRSDRNRFVRILKDRWADARRFDSAKTLLTHFPYALRESARRVNRVAPPLEMPEYQASGSACSLAPSVRQSIEDFLRFQARNDPGSIHSAVELAVNGEWDGAAEDLLNFWNDRDKNVEKLLLRHFPFALRTAAGFVGKLRNGQLFHEGRNVPLPDPVMVPVTP